MSAFSSSHTKKGVGVHMSAVSAEAHIVSHDYQHGIPATCSSSELSEVAQGQIETVLCRSSTDTEYAAELLATETKVCA